MCHLKSTFPLTLLHSERPKLYAILAFLSAIVLGCTHANESTHTYDSSVAALESLIPFWNFENI